MSYEQEALTSWEYHPVMLSITFMTVQMKETVDIVMLQLQDMGERSVDNKDPVIR